MQKCIKIGWFLLSELFEVYGETMDLFMDETLILSVVDMGFGLGGGSGIVRSIKHEKTRLVSWEEGLGWGKNCTSEIIVII